MGLPDTHDPDWWINQRLASGDIDREALLPVVVLLRKEYERRAETLAGLPTEQSAREYAEDFTARVHEDRRENPFQVLLAPAWDGDDAARSGALSARRRRRRSRPRRSRRSRGPVGAGGSSADGAEAPQPATACCAAAAHSCGSAADAGAPFARSQVHTFSQSRRRKSEPFGFAIRSITCGTSMITGSGSA